MDQNLDDLIDLIQQSPLDQTIKDILIRDLKSEGLTDFLKEQINAYCLEGLKHIESKKKQIEEALSKASQQNPS